MILDLKNKLEVHKAVMKLIYLIENKSTIELTEITKITKDKTQVSLLDQPGV